MIRGNVCRLPPSLSGVWFCCHYFSYIVENSKLKHTHFNVLIPTSLILIFRFSCLKWRTEENVNHCLENWEGKINALVWVVLINEAQFKGPYHPFPSTKKRENVGIFHIVFKSVSQHNCRNQAGSPNNNFINKRMPRCLKISNKGLIASWTVNFFQWAIFKHCGGGNGDSFPRITIVGSIMVFIV